MLGNQSVKNEKPRDRVGTKSQGWEGISNGNSTTPELSESKSRWEKGQELFKSGAGSIGKDGYFQVNRFKVDTDPVRYLAMTAFYKVGIKDESGKTEYEIVKTEKASIEEVLKDEKLQSESDKPVSIELLWEGPKENSLMELIRNSFFEIHEFGRLGYLLADGKSFSSYSITEDDVNDLETISKLKEGVKYLYLRSGEKQVWEERSECRHCGKYQMICGRR